MAAVLDVNHVALVNLRADKLVFGGHGGKRLVDVQLGQHGRGFLDARALLGHIGAHSLEQLVFQRADLVRSAENRGLHVLELLGDVALTVCQSLLADVAVGHLRKIGFCHLNVVAEHLVVADAQRFDAGLLPLLVLHPLNPALAVGHHRAQAVDVLVVARGDDAALPQRKRGILADRLLHEVAHIAQQIKPLADLPEPVACAGEQQLAQLGQHRDRGPHRAQILGVGAAVYNPGDQPFEVEHVREQLAQLLPEHKAAAQLLHRVLPSGNGAGGEQRMLHPFAQHPRAGGRAGFVEHPEQRALFLLGAHRFGQLEVAPGVHVHLQILPVRVDVQPLDVGDISLLGIPDVVQHGADRADQLGVLIYLGAQALPELLPHQLAGSVGGKADALRVGEHNFGMGGKIFSHLPHVRAAEIAEQLARRIGADLVFDAGLGAGARKGGCVDLRGGDVGKADAARELPDAECAEVIVLLLREQVGLNQRAGGHHTDDLPPHQPLCQRRILDLLADGHLVALFDQLADINLTGVKGNAAHRGALGLAAVPPG